MKNNVNVAAARRAISFLCGVAALSSAATGQVTSNGTNTSDVQDAGAGNKSSADNAAAGNDRNAITIVQTTTSSLGDVAISQLGRDNKASVTNKGARNKTTAVQGSGRLPSMFNQLGIVQEEAASDSIVWIAQFEGSQAAPNVAKLTQAASSSLIDVSVRGYGNSTDVLQTGSGHKAQLSMLGGGVSVSGAPQGNSAVLKQSGANHAAAFSIGNGNGFWGRGNSADVVQAGSNHLVRVWQRGNSDGVAIEQSDSGNPNSKADPYRAVADISQFASGSTVAVKQVGYTFALVSQGAGYASSVKIVQTESSNGAVDKGSAIRVSQSGKGNFLDAAQSGDNLTASVWQKAGSEAVGVLLKQGIRASASDVHANLVQSGSGNSIIVDQAGSQNAAFVTQLGTGGSSILLRNSVSIYQDNINNLARVTQTADVGPSTSFDPSNRGFGELYSGGSGARESKVFLWQSGQGGSIVVEQQGKGQHVRVEQDGIGNVASVLQTASAVNATVYLMQSGTGNRNEVRQDRAGEFLKITQTGSNNTVTPTIIRN